MLLALQPAPRINSEAAHGIVGSTANPSAGEEPIIFNAILTKICDIPEIESKKYPVAGQYIC